MLRRLLPYVLLSVSVFFITLGVYSWVFGGDGRRHALTVSAGSPSGTRHQIAEYLAAEADSANLRVTVVGTAGSVETVRKVQAGEIDLALIQGSIRPEGAPDLRQVAALHLEPLHLLAKQGIADIGDLRGKSVNVSTPGSGTQLLSQRLLRFAGLDGQYTKTELSYADLLARLDAGEPTPDAVFLVATPPSRVARRLVAGGGYHLVPLRFASAFAMVSVDEEAADTDRINQLHIRSVDIPPFTYGVTPAVPAGACPTVGTRLLLVAHKDVPADAVMRLLPLVYRGTLEKLYHPPPMADVLPEFPPHDGAVAYMERDRPLVRAELLEDIERVGVVAGPLIAGLAALFGFYWWRRQLRFKSYFQRLDEIEALARGETADPTLPPDHNRRRVALHNHLDALQREAVRDFCDNSLRGEGVLQTLIELIRDAKARLDEQAAGHTLVTDGDHTLGANHAEPNRADRGDTADGGGV